MQLAGLFFQNAFSNAAFNLHFLDHMGIASCTTRCEIRHMFENRCVFLCYLEARATNHHFYGKNSSPEVLAG